MRILHTSDWHIGKRLMGRERLDEQSAALDEIVGICEREEVETTAFGCPPPRPCPKSLGFISSEMRENPCR